MLLVLVLFFYMLKLTKDKLLKLIASRKGYTHVYQHIYMYT